MKVELSRIPAIIGNYIEKHMIKEVLASGIANKTGHAFALGSGAYLVQRNSEAVIADPKVLSVLSMLGIVVDDQYLDIECTKEALMAGLKSCGGKVTITLYSLPILGELVQTFSVDDITNLCKIAESFVTQE